MNETTEVIAMVNDLEHGSVMGAGDVAVASMVAHPHLASVLADRIQDVIGLRAPTDLMAAARDVSSTTRDYDEVVETVERSLEAEWVRCCLDHTDLQRESVALAYDSGYPYPEVAHLLDLPSARIKTRMRGGLVRLRGCLGVSR